MRKQSTDYAFLGAVKCQVSLTYGRTLWFIYSLSKEGLVLSVKELILKTNQ